MREYLQRGIKSEVPMLSTMISLPEPSLFFGKQHFLILLSWSVQALAASTLSND